MSFLQPTGNTTTHRFSGKKREELAKFKIVFKETYNLAYIYKVFHDWLVEEGWASQDETEFKEVWYMQREHPERGKESRIRWRMTKPGLAGPPGLFTLTLDLDFYFLGLKNTEHVWRGQKITAQKSEFEMEGAGSVLVDENKALGKSIFAPFKELLLKRTWKKQYDFNQKIVYIEAYRARDFIINYFKLQPVLSNEKAIPEFYTKRHFE